MKKIYFAIVLVVLCVPASFAQNITKQSYEKARQVLDRAVAAYGGLDALRSVENFSFKAVGDRVQRNQSRRTFTAERTPYQSEITVDAKNNRYLWVQKGGYPGGFVYHVGQAVNKTDMTSFDLTRNTSTARQNLPPTLIRYWLRWLPQYLVLNSVERAQHLRYVGKTEHAGRALEAVSYSNEDGTQMTLYFDSKTGLLTKTETLGTDAFFGDAVYEVEFPAYRTENGRQVPAGRIARVNGEPTEELRFERFAINGSVTDDNFKAPSGLKAVTLPASPPPPVNKLSENVYTVLAGGYNVLVVSFKDYLFVMETPGNDNVSRQAIELIKKTFPGKPIKYVAVSHHHDDHAGGLRAYIAEGATLIAAPGEKSFFEKVVQSKFTIAPDALTRNPQPLKIEILAGGRRVLTDGSVTVEILDIGSGPHAEEMLVAYLPNEKIIFQGDLLNNSSNGDAAVANDTTAHFAEWIEKRKLPVEKIVPVHGTAQTMDNLRQAVTEWKTSKSSAKN